MTNNLAYAGDLPAYVSADSAVLHQKAQPLSFPLNQEDLRDISLLEAKYDAEINCAGLAAPQIGVGKPIIIFAVHDSPEVKKFRKDLTQTMPKTIWINASYTPATEETTEGWEACFSIPDVAGLVARYTQIHYTAFAPQGNKLEGTAEGFLARVIQHEIDHTQGKLFTEKAIRQMPMDEYKAMRQKMMENQQSK